MKRIKLMLMTLLLMPIMVLATTYYVNGTMGNDSNTGLSTTTAKKTIQAMVDASCDGDSIRVYPGTYDPFVTSNKLIRVESIGGYAVTFIDGCGNYSHNKMGWLNFSDEGIARSSNAGYSYTNTVFIGFTVQNLANTDGGRIRNCVFRNNDASSVGGGAVNLAIVENCLIINNRGMNGAAGDRSLFRNCTIVGNSARDLTYVCLSSILENCVVWGNENNNRGDWPFSNWGDSFERSWLVLYSHREVNVFESDPKFVDAENGDYRLASDSPCIDAGDNSYVMSDTDLDGYARIMNDTVDIGCYEFASDGGPYIEKVGGRSWTYMIKNGNASVGDGVNAAVTNTITGEVDIPVTLHGRPVTVIDDYALNTCSNMTAVIIPTSVTTIGKEAFCGCENLSDVYFEGNTIGKIGTHAFLGCYWDLIMHVPAEWQGRGRTIAGYTVWRGGSSDVEKCVNMTVTNVIVQYVLNSIQPEIAVPVSNSVGFVNIITEVASSGAVSVPTEWKDNYPQFETKFGTDFGKALAMKTGKKDGAGNDMFVWQDFVAGTDPTNEKDVFMASITIIDGVPVISYTPELTADQAVLRVYKTYGKMKLTDTAWTDITKMTGEERTNYNFFKVTVEMK